MVRQSFAHTKPSTRRAQNRRASTEFSPSAARDSSPSFGARQRAPTQPFTKIGRQPMPREASRPRLPLRIPVSNPPTDACRLWSVFQDGLMGAREASRSAEGAPRRCGDAGADDGAGARARLCARRHPTPPSRRRIAGSDKPGARAPSAFPPGISGTLTLFLKSFSSFPAICSPSAFP